MRPEDLQGQARSLYESFRSMGLSEDAAMRATAGPVLECYQRLRDVGARPADAIAAASSSRGRSAVDSARVAKRWNGLSESDYQRELVRIAETAGRRAKDADAAAERAATPAALTESDYDRKSASVFGRSPS